MTDRLKGLVVVLEQDIRVDDAEIIINAISMIKGVSKVGKNVRNVEDFIIRTRITQEISEKLLNVLAAVNNF